MNQVMVQFNCDRQISRSRSWSSCDTPSRQRVERLFCCDERAVVRCRLANGTRLILVAVVAMLRAGGSREIAVAEGFARGEEMGWFEHGSTVVVIAEAARTKAATGDRLRADAALLVFGPPIGSVSGPEVAT